jgi:hypothetical protein
MDLRNIETDELLLTKAISGDETEVFALYRSLAAAAIAHYKKLGVHYCGKTPAYGHSFLCGEFIGHDNLMEKTI